MFTYVNSILCLLTLPASNNGVKYLLKLYSNASVFSKNKTIQKSFNNTVLTNKNPLPTSFSTMTLNYLSNFRGLRTINRLLRFFFECGILISYKFMLVSYLDILWKYWSYLKIRMHNFKSISPHCDKPEKNNFEFCIRCAIQLTDLCQNQFNSCNFICIPAVCIKIHLDILFQIQ